MIKDKQMYYTSEKHHYLQRQNEWLCKVYDGKCITKEQFEKQQKEQIQWCSDQWKMNNYKGEVVLEILHIVEDL